MKTLLAFLVCLLLGCGTANREEWPMDDSVSIKYGDTVSIGMLQPQDLPQPPKAEKIVPSDTAVDGFYMFARPETRLDAAAREYREAMLRARYWPDSCDLSKEYFVMAFVKLWDRYAAWCYADSTATFDIIRAERDSVDGVIRWHRVGTEYVHWHYPTFNEFVDWLRKQGK